MIESVCTACSVRSSSGVRVAKMQEVFLLHVVSACIISRYFFVWIFHTALRRQRNTERKNTHILLIYSQDWWFFLKCSWQDFKGMLAYSMLSWFNSFVVARQVDSWSGFRTKGSWVKINRQPSRRICHEVPEQQTESFFWRLMVMTWPMAWTATSTSPAPAWSPTSKRPRGT